MDKIEMKIVALANSTAHQNSYVVILEETEGKRRLPIMIGMNEAQAIAISIEGMKPSRPLTHDLFKQTLQSLGVTLKEICISELKDNIFFATLSCEKENGEIIEIDSRSSDAIALAVRFECPIYTVEAIMEKASVEGKTSSTETSELAGNTDKSMEESGIEELEIRLEAALASEDYELAAKLRDEISKKKGES